MESWTKETESTWLTSTDTDIPLSSIQSIPSENSSEVGFPSEKTANLGENGEITYVISYTTEREDSVVSVALVSNAI